MSTARTVSEHGSFRLVELNGRFAVVEARDGHLYSMHPGAAERPSAPDSSGNVADVVDPADWTDEAEARRLFDDLVERGESLARNIW